MLLSIEIDSSHDILPLTSSDFHSPSVAMFLFTSTLVNRLFVTRSTVVHIWYFC